MFLKLAVLARPCATMCDNLQQCATLGNDGRMTSFDAIEARETLDTDLDKKLCPRPRRPRSPRSPRPRPWLVAQLGRYPTAIHGTPDDQHWPGAPRPSVLSLPHVSPALPLTGPTSVGMFSSRRVPGSPSPFTFSHTYTQTEDHISCGSCGWTLASRSPTSPPLSDR